MIDSIFELLGDTRVVQDGASWARLYYNLSLVECESKEGLEELLATTALGEHVVRRLSDRCVVVDGRRKAQLQRALGRRGYPFRIVDLAPRAPEVSPGEARR